MALKHGSNSGTSAMSADEIRALGDSLESLANRIADLVDDASTAVRDAGEQLRAATARSASSVREVADAVRETPRNGVRAAAGAKDAVVARAHDGAVAVSEHRRQLGGALAAIASVLVAVVAAMVARRSRAS